MKPTIIASQLYNIINFHYDTLNVAMGTNNIVAAPPCLNIQHPYTIAVITAHVRN